MRVLQANKFFYPSAGAETVFFHTRDLLARRGHEVVDFAMADERNLRSEQERWFARPRSYGNGRASARDALASVYSVDARRSLRGLLRSVRPDVAHLHNVYHQLTVSIIDELAAQGIPIVLTLHDYKVACPSYTLFTEGAPCRRCVGRAPVHVVAHRCIKGSVAASAVASAEAFVARGRRSYGKVDVLVAPSRFAGEIARAAGLARPRLEVIPNFLPDAEWRLERVDERPPVFVFAGRLEAIKGVPLLLSAFRGAGAGSLRIMGDGPLAGEVAEAAAASDRIEFLGRVDRERVAAELAGARAVVLPAVWEENCPMSVLEARAAGAAVVVSDRGGLPDLVEDGVDGLVFEMEDPASLARALGALAQDAAQARRLAEAGLERGRREHTEGAHYDRLMHAYEQAISAA